MDRAIVPALVSIIVPAYNAERWIADSIRSAIEQGWQRKEVIIVDDGSRDSTLPVARTFASNSVKVISQENRGASGARNVGLSHAQGDYIQWLDADDLLAPNKIEQQMRFADDGSRLLTSSFGEFLTRPEKAEFRPTVLWQDLTPVDFLLHKFIGNVWMTPAVWLVSRSLTERAGPWDERLTLDDDGEYFARLVSKSSGVKFVPQARMYYRRGNVRSLSRSASDRACESLLISLQLCIDHLLVLENSERTRQASVRLLQNWVDYSDFFFPDAADRFNRASDLARELGGVLARPQISWKYAPIQAMFGWKAARRARTTWSNAKLGARLQLDRLPARTSGK